MPCENAAQSDDYFEFIGEYSGVVDYVKEEFNTECITVIDQRFAIAYVPKMDGHQSTDKTAHTTRSQDVLA